MTELKVDWCSYQAAKYAVEHWHYSKTMPVSKRAHLGVWEDGEFIGAVIFSWGANPNMGKAFGLEMTECVELVRVALKEHQSPVSKIVAASLSKLKKQSPGLRLVVSYADPYHDHVGVIYQAGNWIYSGETAEKFDYMLDGEILQRRAYTGVNYGKARKKLPAGAQKVKMPPKHRYLYPLDRAMRRQIEPLRKPYPKRETCGQSVEGDTASDQEAGAGSIPAARSTDLTRIEPERVE